MCYVIFYLSTRIGQIIFLVALSSFFLPFTRNRLTLEKVNFLDDVYSDMILNKHSRSSNVSLYSRRVNDQNTLQFASTLSQGRI